MWNWLRELYEIRRENKERASVCPACEVFKVELSNSRRTNDMLLSRILTPQAMSEPIASGDPQPIILKHKPWKVKQQELERQDRHEAARIMTEFQNKIKTVNTEELEKQLGIKNA